ncbi:MAG: type II toxin-antitoxin system CcdA family antitoxin [Rhodospirillales bacterium]|nr:type II toxin-antitoxin system CcdA family antitoxin [Rhodospirillales bacterium]
MSQDISGKRRVNLTIRRDVMTAANELGLNVSQAAEDGIKDAIRKAREETAWLKNDPGR